jgi:hypothetical protein
MIRDKHWDLFEEVPLDRKISKEGGGWEPSR